MKTVLEVLKGAYHLLDDKSRWTQHAAAKNKRGEPVPTSSMSAVKWCASGALMRSTCGTSRMRLSDENLKEAAKLLAKAISSKDSFFVADAYKTIVLANDGPDGYELIRAAFRKAIAELEPPLERTARTKERVSVEKRVAVAAK